MSAGNGRRRGPSWTQRTRHVGDLDLIVLEMGRGKPLLVLHEELGCPGPLAWQASLAKSRKLLIPLHPGFGRTPRLEWISSTRDLACFYARFLREQSLAPAGANGCGAPMPANVIGWLATGAHSVERPASGPPRARSWTSSS